MVMSLRMFSLSSLLAYLLSLNSALSATGRLDMYFSSDGLKIVSNSHYAYPISQWVMHTLKKS